LQEYRDFTFLTHASLEFALRVVGTQPNEKITKPLFDKYLDLDPYPEAKEFAKPDNCSNPFVATVRIKTSRRRL